MLLHKKIRFLRLNKGWSQETMADKLEMSPNGYGSIERGETNVQLSRVLQIAKLFDVKTAELFQETDGKNVLNSMGSNNVEIQNNNSDARCYFGETELNPTQSECQRDREQLEFNIEKQIIMIEQKDKEIYLLKKLNELLTATAAARSSPYRVQRKTTDIKEPPIRERYKENMQLVAVNFTNC
jgi:transcriptional regulator with XRE-family HTH domain